MPAETESNFMDNDPSRNWPEDRLLENGNYTCLCRSCKHTFTGHKRRPICKLCTLEGLESKLEVLQSKFNLMNKLVDFLRDRLKSGATISATTPGDDVLKIDCEEMQVYSGLTISEAIVALPGEIKSCEIKGEWKSEESNH